MPEKTRQERSRRAKRQGKTVTTKLSDTGRTAGRSRHATKKSRGVLGQAAPAERSASPARPPGKGRTRQSDKLPAPETGSTRSRRKTLPTEAAVAYRKEERPKQPRNEAPQRRQARSERGSPVQGRKKPPSQRNLTRRGGPEGG